MGNVNIQKDQKATINSGKQLMLTEIQQKIVFNLNKQNKRIITQLKTSTTSVESSPQITNRIQCQSARSLLEDQPILIYR